MSERISSTSQGSEGRGHGAMDINEVFRSGGRSVEFLDRINMASIVMLHETGILPRALAANIARGIAQVMERERTEGLQRSADYLDYEPRLLAETGPEGSRLHTGRSRQDLSSTIARMNLRAGLLDVSEALLTLRTKLLSLAVRHTQTIIPAYTHGVQAQPTTFAHYLLAFEAAMQRQSERLRQAYARINRSPLGAAALATSSFPLDRRRLATRLGFEGLVENAYDANHLAPIDGFLDVAGALAMIAVQAGQFAQDIHAQYDDPKPWFMLAAGELTGVSSIMPQKRNPAALEQLRAQASMMLGEMQTMFLLAHNVRTGMFDYRMYDPVPCARPVQVLVLFQQIVDGIVVDRERALAEVRADYSTTTEIADALLQKAEVPFRIGHHFASRLTDYGRSNALKLHEIPFAEVERIYTAETKQPLPLTEGDFREVISAEYMVFGRRGIGGPQLAEVNRMLGDQRERAAADRSWLNERNEVLRLAGIGLDTAFAALAARSMG
jgi:argininosuccinate lyase